MSSIVEQFRAFEDPEPIIKMYFLELSEAGVQNG